MYKGSRIVAIAKREIASIYSSYYRKRARIRRERFLKRILIHSPIDLVILLKN